MTNDWYTPCIKCIPSKDSCIKCINNIPEPFIATEQHCENICLTCENFKFGCAVIPSGVGYDDKGNGIVVTCNSYEKER